MAAIRGSDGIVSVGGNTAAQIRSFTLDTTQDTLDVSYMGDTNRRFIKGMRTFTGSMDLVLDDTSPQYSAIAAFDVFSDSDPEVEVIFYPEGDTIGDMMISGNVIITGFSITASYDGLVEATASFQGTNGLTFGVKA
jgi:predicted secreted protein